MPVATILTQVPTSTQILHWYSNPEWITAIATGLLTIASFIALWQIKIAKESIKKQSGREAAKYATELVREYLNNIIPLIDKFDDLCTGFGVSYISLNLNLKEFTKEEISKQDTQIKENYSAWLQFTTKYEKELLDEQLDAMNSIEAFATPLARGVADEEIAFNGTAASFVKVVERYYALYSSVRSVSRSPIDYFDNTIRLYNVWSVRLKKSRLSNLESLTKQTKE